RMQGVGEWQPLTIDQQATGQRYWVPQTRGPFDIRLRVRDKADNAGAAYLFLPGSGAAVTDGSRRGGYDAGYPNQPQKPMGQPGAPAKIVGSTDIKIDYKLEDVGPSGVSLVELWFTRDGRTWQRYGENSKKDPPFEAKLPGEGVYGL